MTQNQWLPGRKDINLGKTIVFITFIAHFITGKLNLLYILQLHTATRNYILI